MCNFELIIVICNYFKNSDPYGESRKQASKKMVISEQSRQQTVIDAIDRPLNSDREIMQTINNHENVSSVHNILASNSHVV